MATKTKGRGATARQKQSLRDWAIGLGLALLIIVPIVINVSRSANLPGEGFASQGNTHISDVGAAHPAYNSTPATSGWHVGNLASWGTYDYEVPEERLLHNMEDGGVILYYPLGSPEENNANIDKLAQVAQGYRRTIVAPHPDVTGYTLAAWQRLQTFESLDEAGMQAFLNTFEGVDHH